jgi:aspartyl protease family protein
MLSSGQRAFFVEVASWALVACVTVVSVTHFDTIKAIAHQIAGTDPALLAAARPEDGPVNGQDPTEAAQPTSSGYSVELPVASDGHYHAEVEINGRPVGVLVDTGATVVALTADDADAAGIYVTEKDFTGRIQTANGAARVAPVLLDKVSIGDITVRDVRAVVSEPGALGVSLLGMTFLGQLERVDMRSGKLILQD